LARKFYIESASALATSLEAAAEFRITPDLALVSLVGQNVARDPIISARAMNSLPNLSVRMIFHGASDMNLSFVVDGHDADRTVRALHRALFCSDSDVSPAGEILPQNSIGREAINVGEA
jgi:aspartokinase